MPFSLDTGRSDLRQYLRELLVAVVRARLGSGPVLALVFLLLTDLGPDAVGGSYRFDAAFPFHEQLRETVHILLIAGVHHLRRLA